MAARPSPQTERVVNLIEALAALDSGGLTLAGVSRRLGVHKASCHSMLSALLDAGWLQRDAIDLTYQLGPALVRLGGKAASRFPALDQARPVMDDLSASTGAHCIAFTIGTDHVTVVDQVRSPRAVGHPMAVGMELPVGPPYGASLASWWPDDQQEAWLAAVPETVRDRYRKSLGQTRRRGYAIGLHVLADVRLQELAALIRATETRGGKLGDLAGAATAELMASEEWFPRNLAAQRRYEVSHIDSPVFDADGRPVLILSLVPVPGEMSGAEANALGRVLARRTAVLSRDISPVRATAESGRRSSV